MENTNDKDFQLFTLNNLTEAKCYSDRRNNKFQEDKQEVIGSYNKKQSHHTKIDSSSEQSNEHCLSLNPLYKAFNPIMWSLMVVGLHCPIQNNKGSGYYRLLKFYSWTVTIIAWLMVIRSLSVLRFTNTVGPALLSGLSMSIWTLLCALNATSFLVTSLKIKNRQKFFMGFTKLKGGPYITPAQVGKYVCISTVISWAIIAFNFALLGFFIFGTELFEVLVTDPLPPTYTTGRIAMKFIYLFLFFYQTAMWIFPSTFEICISLMLSKEFQLFRKSFWTQVSRNGGYLDNLEAERRRFLDLLRILSAADRCLSFHHIAAFGCDIVNACLILYIIIYYPFLLKVPTALFAYVFWLVSVTLDVIVVCICGILVNSEVSVLTLP